MANGDYDLKIQSKTPCPGGGWTITGVPKQRKSKVIAYLEGTYVASGVLVQPADLGLDTIDFIKIEAQSLSALESTDTTQIGAEYIRSTGAIWCYVNVDSGTEETAGHAVILRIHARGDDATAPELL